MSMLEWWRNRNERWAKANLTLAKYDKIQKMWARIERLGTAPYFVLSIIGGTAWAMLASVVAGYAFGTIPMLRRNTDPFYLHAYLYGMFRLSVFIAIVFSVFYYFTAKEGARWPRPEARG